MYMRPRSLARSNDVIYGGRVELSDSTSSERSPSLAGWISVAPWSFRFSSVANEIISRSKVDHDHDHAAHSLRPISIQNDRKIKHVKRCRCR